jgi:hypothetical protein
MSATLQGALKSTLGGLLKPKIESVITGFGKGSYSGPDDPVTAQDKFIAELSTAITDAVSEAVAKEVQLYLNNSVTVTPGTQVVATAGGPTSQVGTTTTPGKLTAP